MDQKQDPNYYSPDAYPGIQSFSVFVGLLSILISLNVFVGWWFDIGVLKSVVPGFSTMKFNAAIALLLCGGNLLLLYYSRWSHAITVSRLLSALIFLIGAATLSQTAFNIDLGIDQFFISDLAAAPGLYAGRMAMGTALCLVLFGLGLVGITSNIKWLWKPSQYAIHVISIISLMAIIGYLYNTPYFHKLTFLSSMAVHTALVLFLVSVAASLYRPHLGISGIFVGERIGNIMARRVFPAMFVFALATGFLRVKALQRELISPQFGVSAVVIVFSLVVLVMIAIISTWLNNVDQKRTEAEDNINQLNRELEVKITERTADLQKTLEKFQQSENRFRNLMESAPDAMVIIDRQGVIQLVNAQTEKLFGYTKQGMIGQPIELLLPENINRDEPAYTHQFFSHPNIRNIGTGYELCALRVSGEVFPVEMNLSPLETEAGPWTSASIRDISERKRSEELLRSLTDRLSLATSAAKIGIWDMDFVSTESMWDDTMYELYGVTRQTSPNASFLWENGLHPEDKAHAMAEVQKAIDGEKDFNTTYRIVWPDSSVHYINATGVVQRNKAGKPVRILGTNWDITEQKEFALQLKATEERLQLALDGMTAGLWEWNLQDQKRWRSPKYYQLLGYEMTEELPDNGSLKGLLYPEDHTRAMQTMAEGRNSKKRFELELRYLTKSGDYKWFKVTGKAEFDENDKPLRLVGSIVDIDEKKKAEERLELAFDGMVAGLWEWEPLTGLGWWSPRYYELLGYDNNELEYSIANFKKMLFPDDMDMVFATMAEYATRRDRFEKEVRFNMKGGGSKWFRVTGKTKFDDKDQPMRMVGSIIDIDAEKKNDITLRQQAALIKMMPDGVIYGDLKRKVISLNEGAEKLFEITSEEAVGKSYDDLIWFKVVGGSREKSWAKFLKTGFLREEMEVTNRAGKKFTVLLNIKMLENLPGTEPGWVAIYTDISPLRLNAELKEALQKLEAGNRYLEQLAYISSHDIKSPIVTLDGLISLLDSAQAVKPEYAEVVRMLQNTVGQMQRTNHSLNNILKLRKNLLHKEDVNDQVFPLRVILNDVKAILQSNLEASGGQLLINLQDITLVQFPYVHLKSIFYNLLNNAIKYRDLNRSLTIHITGQKTGDNKFLFTITDNGLGIDMEQNKDKLFGIFKRFHDHVEGSGVGLHIVKSIIDAYGGQIEVESEQGKGTTFKFTINNPNIAS